MSRDVGRKLRENCFIDVKKRVFGIGGEIKYFIIYIIVYDLEG